MPPKNSKSAKKTKKNDENNEEDHQNEWRYHNLYYPGVSFNRIVTRSQVAFNRIKKSDSIFDLFADQTRHQPPGQPHVMEVMKGKYGAIPRTIITRSTGQFLSESEDLNKMLEIHKNYKPDPILSNDPEFEEDEDYTTADEESQ